MISDYLNQAALWHKATGQMNEYAEPGYNDPVEIAVRWEGKRRLVRDKEGREVVSEARVFATAAVQPGDILQYDSRDWLVINVSVIFDIDGTESHREVAV